MQLTAVCRFVCQWFQKRRDFGFQAHCKIPICGTRRSLVSITSGKGHATHGSVLIGPSVVSKATRLGCSSALKDLHLWNQKIARVYLGVKIHATHGGVSIGASVVLKATRLRCSSALKDLQLRNQKIASVYFERKSSCNSRQYLDWRVSSFKSGEASGSMRSKRSPFAEPKGLYLRA